MNEWKVFLLLIISVSLWAMEPVNDSYLSSISSPVGLNVSTCKTMKTDKNIKSQHENGSKKDDAPQSKRLGISANRLNDDMKKDAGDARTLNIKDARNGTVHSIEYPDGHTSGRDEPIITDLRPDGKTQLRIYITKGSRISIKPKSWTDIKAR